MTRFCKGLLLCALIIGLFRVGALYAEDLSGGALGFSGFHTSVRGYYEKDFKHTQSAGVDIIPVMRNWFTIDLSMSYRHYTLAHSPESRLRNASAGLGGRVMLKMGPIAPYAGFIGGGDYLRLDTKITDERKISYKPSGAARAGVFIFFPAGFTADFRGEMSYREITGKPFRTVSVGGGILFRFGGSSDVKQTRTRLAAEDFSEGVKSYNARRLREAEQFFLKIPRSDSLYEETRKYVSDIAEAKRIFSQAQNLIKQDKLLDSIPLLEQVSPKMREAEDELGRVRKILSEQVDYLQRVGVAAYEAKDYKKCIGIMKMIAAIDPENRVVRIYLPRSLKREQALQQDD